MTSRYFVGGLALAGVMSGAATGKPSFDPATGIAFVCAVSGAGRLRPAMTPAQICAIFKRKIDGAIARPSKAVAAWPVRGNAIRVKVRIDGPNGLSAAASTRARGKTVHVPEMTVDVMDKAVGFRDVETLATQLAQMIAP